MKICLIGKGLPRIPPEAGIPVTVYMHTLAEQLVQLGHSVDIVCAPQSGTKAQIYNVVEIGKKRFNSQNSFLQLMYELVYSFRLGLSLKKLQRQNGYDIIHFFETPATAFAALLCRRRDMPPFIFSSGKPVSGSELAFESQDSPLYVRLPGDFMHRYVFRRITRVTTSSRRLREVLIKRVKVAPDRVSVTPFIAAEPDRFYPGRETVGLRKELGLAEADRVVLCLGEVSPYKNQLSLVKAIPDIVARHPETKFVFAGAILDDYRRQIDDFVRAHSLDDRVIFTGFIRSYADLPAYYNLADIYVLLSRSEGNLPKTILEAMSCGRAVIAADIPQNREGAREGDEIIFVDPYDTGEIAAAVNRLLDDAGLRQRLGENARQSVLKYHAPEVIARGMVKVYEEVLYRHHKG